MSRSSENSALVHVRKVGATTPTEGGHPCWNYAGSCLALRVPEPTSNRTCSTLTLTVNVKVEHVPPTPARPTLETFSARRMARSPAGERLLAVGWVLLAIPLHRGLLARRMNPRLGEGIPVLQ